MAESNKMKRLLLIAALGAALTAQAQNILVGTYTQKTDAEGVYLYSYNPETAETELKSVAKSGNPSFVIATKDGSMAYSVNEFYDARQGVSAYTIKDQVIEKVDSLIIPRDIVDGADPCNLLLLDDALISTNYTGGSVTAFRLRDDGRFNGIAQYFSYAVEHVRNYSGVVTSTDIAHMHCAVLSPDGKYIFVTNLGNDCIHRFELGENDNPLKRSEIAWENKGLLTKVGPRHMIFSADGRYAYLLGELSDRLIVFGYHDGNLFPVQDIKAYKGRGKGSADIHLSPDGRFLYTSHRLKKDGIAIFKVNQTNGQVVAAGYQPTGRHPRNFAISPDGRYLLAACRDDNRIEIYSIDKETGLLTLTDKTIEVPAPVCVQFL